MFTEAEKNPYAVDEMGTVLYETEVRRHSELDAEFYTPEEAYELVMSDIKSIYGIKDEV